MAGFETIVRPVVFPNIRPTVTRALPITDAPDKGIATITGGGGTGLVELSFSSSTSSTASRRQETKRKYDVARLYKTSPGGTVDKSSYWDFEVARRSEFLKNNTEHEAEDYAHITEADNIEMQARGLTRIYRPGDN